MENNKKERGHATLVKIVMVLYDAIAVNAAVFLAIILRFYVRFEFHNGAEQYIPIFWNALPVFTIISLVIFYFSHLYNTMWEWSTNYIHHLLPLPDGNVFVTAKRKAYVVAKDGHVVSTFTRYAGNKPGHQGVCMLPDGTMHIVLTEGDGIVCYGESDTYTLITHMYCDR